MLKLSKKALSAALILLFRAFAAGQQEEALSKYDANVHLQVRAVTADDRAVARNLQVRLMFVRDFEPIVTVSTNSEGVADITVPRTGNFRVEISGPGIETTVSEPFTVTKYDRNILQTIRVELKKSAAEKSQPTSPGVANAQHYSIPKEATKEFDAGVGSLRASDWKGAEQHFLKAIELYPKFDQAYDDLGMARQNGGDFSGARSAYEKAIELNDHNADALRNLGRLMEREKNWSEAEKVLIRSLGIEPNHPGSLALLAVAEMSLGKTDEAMAAAQRVHSQEHKSYAVVHLVLAKGYELKQQPSQAIEQYQLFLKEDPSAPQADGAKKRLAQLQATG